MDSKVPVRQADGSSDRRWIVVTDQGGFSSLGRATDPTDDEVAAAEQVLVARGVGGWLAVAEHSFYEEQFPSCVEVRTLGAPTTTFEAAVDLLRASLPKA
jgi:hypothetical protein